jgi:signal peptidase I
VRVACCAILAALAGLGVQGCSHVYRVPSSSMEPTLHCGRPGPLCQGKQDDRVVVRPVKPAALRRGDIVVFETPSKAELFCGSTGTYIKRVIGLPGEIVREDAAGYIRVDGRRLREPYIPAASRRQDVMLRNRAWHVPPGRFLLLGDNRPHSCDSRIFGAVAGKSIRGVVTTIRRGGREIKVR